MTKLTSPSEQKRKGRAFKMPFREYLQEIITIDPTINAVCIALDEEGNEYWELNPEETKELIKRLKEALKELQSAKP